MLERKTEPPAQPQVSGATSSKQKHSHSIAIYLVSLNIDTYALNLQWIFDLVWT